MSVVLEVIAATAHVTFDRPRQGNTIDVLFGQELLAIAQTVSINEGIRAVLMTGSGAHFCLGGDLRGMAAAGRSTSEYLRELTINLHRAVSLFTRMSAPVIVAVNGTAAGAGFGLVLASDLVIAAKSAKFRASYLGVGLTPDAGCSFFLPRAVGAKRAMELFMTNRVLDCNEALAWGIVNQVVEDGDLTRVARELADSLAAGPKGAFGALKQLMAESYGELDVQLDREGRSIAARGESAEGREGITAFLQKRSPHYE